MDLMSSLRYAGGAALTGGAASAANVLFGVTVIGLLVFQVGRSTRPAAERIFVIHSEVVQLLPKATPRAGSITIAVHRRG